MSLSSQTFKRLLPEPKDLEPAVQPHRRRSTILVCVVIAVIAIGARLLLWQDNRPNFSRVFSGMVQHHQDNARVLLKGEFTRFITGPAPPGDANILTYPPGYPIIMAIVFCWFDEADSSMRLFQVVCDAAAAVLLFFVAGQFLPRAAAIIAALLAALSPQLAYYSLLLLPDSLATLPILLALYFLIRAVKSPNLFKLIAAGVCIGLSCWLRSNALLLAPFLAVVVFAVVKNSTASPAHEKPFWRRGNLKGAAALAAASLIVIAPITIRNLIVFHRLIPLSLGAGQMLNVGIGDYDKQRRFGLPGTDLETVTSEAAKYNRPDYTGSLFGGDGVDRDQRRFANGVTVIREHPMWFASVLLRRSVSMFKLERVRPVSRQPAPGHSLSGLDTPVWAKSPRELFSSSSDMIKLTPGASSDNVLVEASSERSSTLVLSAPLVLERKTDYVLRLPVKLVEGNLVASVQSSSLQASSNIFHPLETSSVTDQPTVFIEVPFVSGDSTNVTLVLANEGKRPVRTVAEIGKIELFRLGPSSFAWTGYVRVLVSLTQKFFITAWLLPFAVLGMILMWRAGKDRYLLVLLAIPLYYVCAQSFLHTEHRYVMAIQYSLFICAAVALYWLGLIVIRATRLFDQTKTSV